MDVFDTIEAEVARANQEERDRITKSARKK